eukprot:3796297-Alexandrium_andersonii.AAC.1
MIGAHWVLTGREGTHVTVLPHIERALDEAWAERRLTAHWNGLISGPGDPWCAGPASATFTD